MITTFYPPYNFGGDGIAVQRLSRALTRRGHHVEVVHDVDAWRLLSDGPEPRPEALEEEDGVRVHRLESGWGPLSPLLTQQTGRPVANRGRIREILGDGRFDVVNYHNVSLVGGPGVLSLGDAAKLYTAHEHWLVCPTHVLWRHDREPCTGRECLRCQWHHRRPPQAWRHTGFLERQLEHVDLFIARSEFSRRKHREFGFPREMEVVPYFLDPADGRGSGDGADETGDGDEDRGGPTGSESADLHPRPYFLFVGRLEKIKGLQDVIPSFRHEPVADLLVAGDGEYGDELRSQAAGCPAVHFLGRVPQDRLRRYYRDALAVLVPSVGYETFGIVLIEAFREGTPVLARRRGPFPEIVERSGGGRLFGDRDELEDAMERLRNDPDHRRTLGRRARRAFLDHWSEGAVVPRYLELARRTVRGGRRPRPGSHPNESPTVEAKP
jgi:glycosyltransferase involved in cell wall biosynthesis